MPAETVKVNKSAAVRKYLKANRKSMPKDVAAALKDQGIDVSPAMVSTIKFNMMKKGSTNRKEKAAAAALPAKKKPGPKSEKPAASTNGSAVGGTKAEAIRTVAKSLPKPLRSVDIRAELAKQGIDASSTFIGKVLRSAGMKRKRRRKAAAGSAAPAVASNSASLNINDLVMAKKLVAQVGSIEKVKEALAALAKLG